MTSSVRVHAAHNLRTPDFVQRGQPDILLLLSDQHAGQLLGCVSDSRILTPNLDRMAEEGTRFASAYTSCPLCVPARSGLLTGLLPSHSGIFTNRDALHETLPTFLHGLSIAGYETVLCGRMHFMGSDQRHGFTKRIFGDITPGVWGKNEGFHRQLGDFAWTTEMSHCLDLCGEGDSPVLAYDEAVISAAQGYLQQPRKRPLCMVVGLYGPHFPYVAYPEDYQAVAQLVTLPIQHGSEVSIHPVVAHKMQYPPTETLQAACTAYWGMIRFVDRLAGKLYDSFELSLQQQRRTGVRIYLSDHGDQLGEKNLFGKQTFYEGSSHVPCIFAGDGIPHGKIVGDAVSLLDIGPTLCEMGGAALLPSDGESLMPFLTGDAATIRSGVIAEFIEERPQGITLGRMLVHDAKKYITYSGWESDDELFDLSCDPHETTNIAAVNPTLMQSLRARLPAADIPQIIDGYRRSRANVGVIEQWAKLHPQADPDMWAATVVHYPVKNRQKKESDSFDSNK